MKPHRLHPYPREPDHHPAGQRPRTGAPGDTNPHETRLTQEKLKC